MANSNPLKREDKLVKKIKTLNGIRLISRSLNDIAEDKYGVEKVQRPLVLLDAADDACEKALWFYEKNILPLIGETNNLEATARCAKAYGIDCVLSEESLIYSFWDVLKKIYDTAKIEKVILLGSNFNLKSILNYFYPEKVRLVLYLPEIGPFAYACCDRMRKKELIFHFNRNSFGEIREDKIIKISKYKTNAKAEFVKNVCQCGKQSFRLI
jgi:hypothetical protein